MYIQANGRYLRFEIAFAVNFFDLKTPLGAFSSAKTEFDVKNLHLKTKLSHDATDGREKDGGRSLKTSHLGHCFDDGYISLTSSHIVRRGTTGASQNELYKGI